MSRERRLVWTVLVAVVPAMNGCAPRRPVLFDADALASAHEFIVLPLTDGPGPNAQGSGKALRGAIVSELLDMGDLNLIHFTEQDLKGILDKLGYSRRDCYDPVVAAAVAKTRNADTVVTGEVTHYDSQQERGQTTILVLSGGGTSTTHWVSANVRVLRASDGKIIYTGTGTTSSDKGYSDAARGACKQAFASMRHFLAREKKRRK